MKYKNYIEHYKNDAEFYDFFNLSIFSRQEYQRRYQTMFNLHEIKKNENILEVGSGGSHALEFIKSSKYYPLDISTHNLKKMKNIYSRVFFPVSGNVYNLPFEADSFDLIILSEVLEHLDNPEKALRQIYRVLKKNGSFVISVPYKEVLSYQICIHCNQITPTNAHLHSFDEDNLESLLNEIGFNIIKRTKCLNKISNRLYVNILLKRLPFKCWRLIDRLFNYITDKPASLMFLCNK
ncbi:MAG: class I SAM-dependent methyltransferase [Bacteroidota bacterium]